MFIRRFIMEDWLASYKDACIYNLGESGMPDSTVGALLNRCGLGLDSLAPLVLKDNDTRGSDRLRRAIRSTYHQMIGLEQITVTTGTSEALFILFNLLLNGSKSAVVPKPSFQALYEVPRALGADLRFYHIRAESGFLPDPDEICRMIDDSTGVVLINTPHNPSGRLFPEDAAEAVIRKAAFHGATVISDEHYRFLPLNGESPLRTLASPDENVIAAGSLTKCFGVIGLRVGWIAAPEKLIAKVRDFRDYLTHTLSPVSDFLAAAALEHAPAFIEPNRETLRRNLAALESMVKETTGISLVSPEAGAVAFPAFGYGISSDEFARGLIDKHGVFVLPGSAFETEGHFRINLGQEPDSFRRALVLIGEYCAGPGGIVTRIGFSYNLKDPAFKYNDLHAEYETPETIKAIARTLSSYGDVVSLPCDETLVPRLANDPPDLMFNIAEGAGGRDRESFVPALCSMLGMPCTGSDAAVMALTMDKALTKRVLRDAGIRTPEFILVNDIPDSPPPFGFPAFVKPNCDGSSRGICGKSLVSGMDSYRERVGVILKEYQQPALVEPYLEGRDLCVGLLGNDPPRMLQTCEVLLGHEEGIPFFSFEYKRHETDMLDLSPSGIDTNEMENMALSAWNILGCRDYARMDYRTDSHGVPFLLEVNALPGLSPVSGILVRQAAASGIPFDELIGKIFERIWKKWMK